MRLSSDQEQVLADVTDWYVRAPAPWFRIDNIGSKYTVGSAHEYPVCAVGGYAGTGKTTILREVGEAHARTVFCTPTHKAAAVLRSKLPARLADRVRTFHSLIYQATPVYHCRTTGLKIEVVNEECACGHDECECVHSFVPCHVHANPDGNAGCDVVEDLRFERRTYLSGHYTAVVVDEASMLTEQQVQDIRSFGLAVLLIGDHGQLPPVKGSMNPWIKQPKLTLTVNHRQGETSGIIQAAEAARTTGHLYERSYGHSAKVIPVHSSLARALMDRFQPDCRDRAVIVQYNESRAALNRMFHARVAANAPDDELLINGERIVALQREETVPVVNAKGEVYSETFLFNGTLATVLDTTYVSQSGKVVEVVAELDSDWRGQPGVRVLLRVATEQLGRPKQLDYRSKPHSASLWDYAYAITAHRAQGSEFSQVLVWYEGRNDPRWLYTAVTRARDALVVLI